MPYFDCYRLPVPRCNRAAYEELARLCEAVAKEYGALQVVECWLDESGPDAATYHATAVRQESAAYGTFRQAASAREDEAVVISVVEWADKPARDRGMQRLTDDPRMQLQAKPAVFDGRRLIAGGFKPMLARKGAP